MHSLFATVRQHQRTRLSGGLMSLQGLCKRIRNLLELLTSTEESVCHKTSSSCHTQP